MRVSIIGVPMDLGAGRRGVDMGPSALRYSLLERKLRNVGLEVIDHGDLRVPIAERLPSEAEPGRVRYERPILDACAELEDAVAADLQNGNLPLVVGGDHSIAMGSARGVHRVHPAAGLLWLDAHGDCNTAATSPSGNVHGMPVAALLGLQFFERPTVDPQRTVLVGVRDLDPGEKRLLREQGVTVFTMHEIDRFGMSKVMEQALQKVGPRAHVSFDLDSLDPSIAPGVGTPVPGGLTYREAFLAMEMIAEAGIATSLDVVELNPILDERNATGELAVRLIAAALGERIL